MSVAFWKNSPPCTTRWPTPSTEAAARSASRARRPPRRARARGWPRETRPNRCRRRLSSDRSPRDAPAARRFRPRGTRRSRAARTSATNCRSLITRILCVLMMPGRRLKFAKNFSPLPARATLLILRGGFDRRGNRRRACGRLRKSSSAPSLEDAQVVRSLVSGGVGTMAHAHGAAKLVERLVFVLLEPERHFLEDRPQPLGAMLKQCPRRPAPRRRRP